MVFFDEALSYLKSKYEQFSQNCDDTFSAKIRFGVLFTDEKNFDKDLKNIKGYFSSNVIDYISEVDTEKALIDEEKKNGDTQQKIVIYRNQEEDDDKWAFLVLEVNFSNLDSDEDLKCPFFIAVTQMFKDFNYDFDDLVNKNYKVTSYYFN